MEAAVDLTVVIVSWNTREDLLRCLRSIAAETRITRLEVIVVDNGSVDGTPDAVREAFPSVRLIALEENAGFGAANNVGLDAAGGQVVLHLNPDTLIVEGGLDRLVVWMREHPDVAAVGCRLEDGAGQIEASIGSFPSLGGDLAAWGRRRRGQRPTPDAAALTTPTEVDWVTGAFLAVRQDLVVGGVRFDPGYPLYVEDVDLCRQIRDGGGRIVFVPELWARHLRGRAPLDASRRAFRRLGEARFHRKWGGVSGRLMAALYWILGRGWRPPGLPRGPASP